MRSAVKVGVWKAASPRTEPDTTAPSATSVVQPPPPGAVVFSRNFVLATIGNLCFFTSVTSFFILPVHLEDLGAGRAEIGRIMGLFGVASLVAIPVTGSLVDRLGRRPFMLWGAASWALLAVLFARIEGLGPPAYLMRFAQGAAFSLTFVATNALIAELAPAGGLGRALAVFGTTTLLTHAVGPSIAERVLAAHGFGTVAFGSALAAVASVLVFALVREPKGEHGVGDRLPRAGMISLALRRGGSSVLVGGLTSAVAFGAAIFFMPVFVRTRGIGSFAPFFAAYVASAIIVRLGAGGLGDRLGHRAVAGAALVVFGCSVSALGIATEVWHLAAIGFVFGAAHGWAYPSLNALLVEQAPSRSRGAAMALYNLSFNVGMTLAAFLAGEVASHLGYTAMWIVTGAGCALGAAALATGRPRRPADA